MGKMSDQLNSHGLEHEGLLKTKDQAKLSLYMNACFQMTVDTIC